jgi:hypothetical protein
MRRRLYAIGPNFPNAGQIVELRCKLAERLHNELEIPMKDVFPKLVGVKRRTGLLEMGLLNMLSDPFGLKGYTRPAQS